MPGIATLLTVSIIGFIISLVFLIINGRVLNKINDASCYKDKSSAELMTAHRWAAWGVGISAVATAVFLGAIILAFF